MGADKKYMMCKKDTCSGPIVKREASNDRQSDVDHDIKDNLRMVADQESYV